MVAPEAGVERAERSLAAVHVVEDAELDGCHAGAEAAYNRSPRTTLSAPLDACSRGRACGPAASVAVSVVDVGIMRMVVLERRVDVGM